MGMAELGCRLSVLTTGNRNNSLHKVITQQAAELKTSWLQVQWLTTVMLPCGSVFTLLNLIFFLMNGQIQLHRYTITIITTNITTECRRVNQMVSK